MASNPDFKIKCANQIFLCHRNVLCKSSYFNTLLRSEAKESFEGEMEINEAEVEDVKAMLDFIYNEKIHENSAKSSLVILADRFDLTDLIDLAMDYLLLKFKEKSDPEIMNAARELTGDDRFFNFIKIAAVLRQLGLEKSIKWQRHLSQNDAQFMKMCIRMSTKFPAIQTTFQALSKVDPKQAEIFKHEILIAYGLKVPNNPRIQDWILFSNMEKFSQNEDICLEFANSNDVASFIRFIREGRVSENSMSLGLAALTLVAKMRDLFELSILFLVKRSQFYNDSTILDTMIALSRSKEHRVALAFALIKAAKAMTQNMRYVNRFVALMQTNSMHGFQARRLYHCFKLIWYLASFIGSIPKFSRDCLREIIAHDDINDNLLKELDNLFSRK